MALKNQLNFSGGELDPLLQDRATLERFQNSLKTARNVIIGKSGTIKTRFSTLYFKKAQYENVPIKCYCPPGLGYILEFGYNPADNERYCLLRDLSGNLIHQYVTSGSDHLYFTNANLQNLQFVTSGKYVYVFEGSNSASNILRLNIQSPYDVRAGSQVIPQKLWPQGNPVWTITTNASGYAIDYGATIIIDNQESEGAIVLNSTITTMKKCISASEKTTIVIKIGTGTTVPTNYTEVRIYSRPSEGSAFGFLGRTTNIYTDGTYLYAKFVDIGGDPDYTQSFPKEITQDTIDSNFVTSDLIPATGTVYQQRLILGNIIGKNNEAILASRPGYQGNFYRDYPYDADSALNFKAGSSGNAKVLRMIESEGLVVFTTNGVYVSVGILSIDNLALERRGKWIIDENIPPLVIPGGLFFVDKTTNSIRQLIYSTELASYTSSNQSIFSDHLFRDKTIKSWGYQEGVIPVVIVTFTDGTFATFTYDFEHQLKAWTRHDTIYPIEEVIETGIADTTFFIINVNGVRHITRTVPRVIPASVKESNPESELYSYGAFMDSMVVKYQLVNDSLTGTDILTLTPVTSGDWEGHLTLSCGTSGIFTVSGPGDVGNVYRFFNPKDKTRLDLTIVSRTNNNTVVVQPSEEFPSEYASGFRLYFTHLVIDGLTHLIGKDVSVICDGDIISSPYNDNSEEEVGTLTVQGTIAGYINLEERSAISIVGLPIVADVKTLNITTAEQAPTMIESMTVNKLYLRVFDSRGMYVSNQYPEDKLDEVDGTSVADMETLDYYIINSQVGLLGNKSKSNISKRFEVTIPGTWENQGEIAIRQVDPIHFEIVSIIADIEVYPRSNK